MTETKTGPEGHRNLRRNGVNQKGVRDHNERLILSVLHHRREVAASDIARQTRLSAQTVSVILRKLEADGLVARCTPIKGKVGKPSVPMRLNPRGAAAIGYKIGRRSSEVCLTDLTGKVLFKDRLGYENALPKVIFDFIGKSLDRAVSAVGPELAARLSGIGIAVPFEIWKWGRAGQNTPAAFLSWKDISFEEEIKKITTLPVFLVNDATSACWAENVYGRGQGFSEYAYFFVSTFIGGGIVLDQSVYEGNRGNAGAFGPMRISGTAGRKDGIRQLLEVASLYTLERELSETGCDPQQLWALPQDWRAFEPQVIPWIERAAEGIAQACLTACSVVDFEAVIIDGFLPGEVRERLVARVRELVEMADSRGLILPVLVEGSIGGEARAIGAACKPIFAQYFLSARAGLKD